MSSNFCVFYFFSLKSIDHHKNPGNTTKEKTNVQLKSRIQSYERDVALEGIGVYSGWEVIPMGMAAVMGDT